MFPNLMAKFAKSIPTDDYDYPEPFFHYLTAVVLVAPLIAVGLCAITAWIVPEGMFASYHVFMTVVGVYVAVSELVCVSAIRTACRILTSPENRSQRMREAFFKAFPTRLVK